MHFLFLGAGALAVNPWSVSDLSNAILRALMMPESERRERNKYLFNHIVRHTSKAWADTFIRELQETGKKPEAAHKLCGHKVIVSHPFRCRS
jgi:trehalose-6-phosphate synthase